MDGTSRSAAGIALEWLAAAAILAPGWLLPLARDQGHFAYCGQVVLAGGMPYVDVFDQKGPATHCTFALIVGLFGSNPAAVRGAFFVALLLCTRVAAALGERLAGFGARLPCALLLALAVFQADGGTAWNTAQVEDIQLLLELSAVWLLAAQGRYNLLRTMLAGLLLGASAAYKPTALVTGLVLALGAIGVPRGAERGGYASAPPRRVARLAAYIGGWVIVPALLAVWLAWGGAVDDCWEILVRFNLAYAELREGPAAGLLMLVSRWGPLCALAACGWLLRPAGDGRSSARLLSLLLCANLALVLWQGKYWPYHWTGVLGVLAIFAGVACGRAIAEFAGRLWEMGRLAWAARPGVVGASLLMALLTAPVDHRFLIELYGGAASVVLGRRSLSDYRAEFHAGAVSSPVHERVAAYLRSHSQPDEPVLVWGYESVLYFLAQRAAPTRFVVDRVLCLAQPRRTAWRAEFLGALERRHPSYIVVVEDNATRFWRDSQAELERFPEFRNLLEREYRLETRFDRCRLYRWRLAGPWPDAGRRTRTARANQRAGSRGSISRDQAALPAHTARTSRTTADAR